MFSSLKKIVLELSPSLRVFWKKNKNVTKNWKFDSEKVVKLVKFCTNVNIFWQNSPNVLSKRWPKKNSPKNHYQQIDPLSLQCVCMYLKLKDMKKIHNTYTFKIRNLKQMLAEYWENTLVINLVINKVINNLWRSYWLFEKLD
jgi:hypothetical protein